VHVEAGASVQPPRDRQLTAVSSARWEWTSMAICRRRIRNMAPGRRFELRTLWSTDLWLVGICRSGRFAAPPCYEVRVRADGRRENIARSTEV